MNNTSTRINNAATRWKKLPQAGKVALIVALLVAGWFFFSAKKPAAITDKQRPQPVSVAAAIKQDVPIYITAMGTATPLNTTLVRSRVDGQIMEITFQEGAIVKQGDLLAVIDERPYEVQRKQAEGALLRDKALLKDAKLTLARYRKLVKEDSISAQQLQTQEALVSQYEGALVVNQANKENAELQLTYCRITAPISGQVGLKKVDVGNMVRASDATGIVSITQIDPMQVVFTLIEKDIAAVVEKMQAATPLVVEAYTQSGKKLLATGALASLDNQIDVTTGTVKAKAIFTSAGNVLFPNQFVDVKLLLTTRAQALVVPTSSIQRDDKGFYVYCIQDIPASKKEESNERQKTVAVANATKQDAGKKQAASNKITKSVRIQKITTSYSTGAITIVESGLTENDQVVVDGVDRLRDNALVQFEVQ